MRMFYFNFILNLNIFLYGLIIFLTKSNLEPYSLQRPNFLRLLSKKVNVSLSYPNIIYFIILILILKF